MKEMQKQHLQTDNGDFVVRFLSRPGYRLARHIVCVGFLLLFAFVSRKKLEFVGAYDIIAPLLSFTILTGLLYANLYLLIPHFFYKKKTLLYLAALFASMIVSIGFLKFLNNTFFEAHKIVKSTEPDPGYVITIVFVCFIIAPLIFASTMLKLFQKWVIDTTRLKELENKYLETQLRELRNQINPHFLFNMLNNINELIFNNPEKASHMVVKFSEFLRYNLEESDQSMVFLKSEIGFLTDLINLEKIRRDSFEVSVTVEGDIKGVKVPPKLFINFVENAIKHSANNRAPSSVQLKFMVTGQELVFCCQNSKPTHQTSKHGTGIGLNNVMQRLELLYGNLHTVDIINSAHSFSVTLKFPL